MRASLSSAARLSRRRNIEDEKTRKENEKGGEGERGSGRENSRNVLSISFRRKRKISTLAAVDCACSSITCSSGGVSIERKRTTTRMKTRKRLRGRKGGKRGEEEKNDERSGRRGRRGERGRMRSSGEE